MCSSRGRSGGRHEIDVFAEKSDGITTFTIAVECKAWNQPIQKEVISKLSYIMNDLGINKGIVVSLLGTRLGADQSAAQLGIDIWGQEEITKRLGQVAVSELEVGPPAKETRILNVVTHVNEAKAIVERQRRGAFGIGSEQVTWSDYVWIPFHCLALGQSKYEKAFLKGRVSKASQKRNLYEAIGGRFAGTITSGDFAIGSLGPLVVQPKVKDLKIRAEIKKTMEKLSHVVTASAIERYASKLRSLGIDADIRVRTDTPSSKPLLHLKGADAERLANVFRALPSLPLEGGHTVRVDDELLADLLEDPDALGKLYRKNPHQFRKLISDDESARDIIAWARRKEQVERFRRLLEESDFFHSAVDRVPGRRPETVWQQFFEDNPWIFGFGLSAQFLLSWDTSKLESTSGASLARRSAGPQALGSLGIRMLAFAVRQLDACDSAAEAEGHASFGHYCRNEYSGIFETQVLDALGL